MNIEYVAPVYDVSGYAASARANIRALKHAGVNINVIPHDFSPIKVEYREEEKEILSVFNRDNFKADVRILHLPADVIHHVHMKDGKEGVLDIGYFFWEIDGMPDIWVPWLNTLHGFILPCTKMKTIMERQGISVPCRVIGQSIDTEYWKPVQEEEKTNFDFYSIFQWTERKNPAALLHAYWSEFSPYEDVRLILKTYLANHSDAEAERLRGIITAMQNEYRISDPTQNLQYPQIVLLAEMTTVGDVKKLHARADCFVLPHRGEGFGIPIANAMAMEKPVIATHYYAAEDYMNDENSYPIDYQERPVWGLKYPWYTAKKVWAEPDIMQIKRAMRHAFENRNNLQSMKRKARETIINKYSPAVFAERTLTAIESIAGLQK